MSVPPSSAELLHLRTRLARIRAEISGRLWPVNSGMSSFRYNDLMDQMALLQLNGELRNAGRPEQIDTPSGEKNRHEDGDVTDAVPTTKDDPPSE